jgi:hypothetical protein
MQDDNTVMVECEDCGCKIKLRKDELHNHNYCNDCLYND